MKIEIYETILRHLSKSYHVDINTVFKDISPINLESRNYKTTTELIVNNQTFYLTDDIIYKSKETFDNIVIAEEVGYLRDDTIFLKNN